MTSVLAWIALALTVVSAATILGGLFAASSLAANTSIVIWVGLGFAGIAGLLGVTLLVLGIFE
jgi:hypothetical protein